jgi:hypothetical protein
MGLTKGVIQSLVFGVGVAFAFLYVAPHSELILTALGQPVTTDSLGLVLTVYFIGVFIAAKILTRNYR